MKFAYATIATLSLLLAGAAFLAAALGIHTNPALLVFVFSLLLTIWSSAELSKLEKEF